MSLRPCRPFAFMAAYHGGSPGGPQRDSIEHPSCPGFKLGHDGVTTWRCLRLGGPYWIGLGTVMRRDDSSSCSEVLEGRRTLRSGLSGVATLYLFGSVARDPRPGENDRTSDLVAERSQGARRASTIVSYKLHGGLSAPERKLCPVWRSAYSTRDWRIALRFDAERRSRMSVSRIIMAHDDVRRDPGASRASIRDEIRELAPSRTASCLDTFLGSYLSAADNANIALLIISEAAAGHFPSI